MKKQMFMALSLAAVLGLAPDTVDITNGAGPNVNNSRATDNCLDGKNV